MHSLAYALTRLAVRLILWPFVKRRVMGRENVARSGALLVAANHISHFDPPLFTIATPRKLDWMAMAELFANPAVAAWLRSVDAFPVDRARPDRATVRTALERLRAGHVVGIFPEGGIRDGARSVLMGAPMRPGVGAIAQLSGAPVVPCVIVGSDRLYAPRSWVPFVRRQPVWIAYGEALAAPGEGKAARAEFEAALGAAWRALLAQMQERFGLTADDLPQPPARRKGRQEEADARYEAAGGGSGAGGS